MFLDDMGMPLTTPDAVVVVFLVTRANARQVPRAQRAETHRLVVLESALAVMEPRSQRLGVLLVVIRKQIPNVRVTSSAIGVYVLVL